jgi:Methyltransferase domain
VQMTSPIHGHIGNAPRFPDYPALRQEHLRDARLYATRDDLVMALPVPKGAKIAEIGVWQGKFSKFLCSQLQPAEFVAFDIFTGHEYEDWNGLTGAQLFAGLSQRQFVERELEAFRSIATFVEGDSRHTLQRFTDQSFNLVYVDGDHRYDAVKADAALAAEMATPLGFLVFNDYLLIDHNHAAYGVVPAVNDLVVNHGWRVVGFALNHGMYCDIAVQRDFG